MSSLSLVSLARLVFTSVYLSPSIFSVSPLKHAFAVVIKKIYLQYKQSRCKVQLKNVHVASQVVLMGQIVFGRWGGQFCWHTDFSQFLLSDHKGWICFLCTITILIVQYRPVCWVYVKQATISSQNHVEFWKEKKNAATNFISFTCFSGRATGISYKIMFQEPKTPTWGRWRQSLTP